jgi:NifB/MoaA-like Fe-S oxidoreductase
MRAHTDAEVGAVLDAVHEWQEVFLAALGRRLVFAADEYYLLAGRPFPDAASYEGFPMHEDGVGMARTFEREFRGEIDIASGVRPGFFQSVDGAPADGYRSPRTPESGAPNGKLAASGTHAVHPAARFGTGCEKRTGIITGEYGAAVLAPLVESLGRVDVRVIPVRNAFFGGTTAVTGLLVGSDIERVLRDQPRDDRYLLPDVCLTRGRFLDETTPDDLPRRVDVIPTDGIALRDALGS